MKLLSVLVICLLVLTIDGQRGRRKQKGKNCHLKEIDKCFDKVEKLTNEAGSSALITNEAGLDRICSGSLEVVDCIGKYMKKCGTPLQNELFKFAVENFNNSVDRFCKSGSLKSDFLKQSPCIHEKVISKDDYKQTCVEPMLASLDKVKEYEVPDDRLDASCCSFNRWDDCTNDLITKGCGPAAKEAMITFTKKAFAGFSTLLCPTDLFNFKDASCKKYYAKKGTKAKGKLSDNPVTKYLASYFGFLFK